MIQEAINNTISTITKLKIAKQVIANEKNNESNKANDYASSLSKEAQHKRLQKLNTNKVNNNIVNSASVVNQQTPFRRLTASEAASRAVQAQQDYIDSQKLNNINRRVGGLR